MRRKKKFTSALSFVLSLLMAVSCIQPVMATQTVPDVESVSEEAAAQAEENEDTNVSVSAAPAKEETSEAPAEESDSDSGSTADLTETKELKSESSDAAEPAALSSDSDISPLADTDAYAILYDSGELVFQRGSTPDASKGTVLGTYTGFETKKYTGYNNYAPWYENRTSIKVVSFKDVIKPVSTAYWFDECRNLTSVDVTNLDTSAVTNMNRMFYKCSALTSLDLSSFNTSAVTDMSSMFNSCSSLTSLDLSSFNTSVVTDMNYMFNSCSSLTSLDLSSFNTSVVTNMESMFSSCSSLTSLDLSSFNTSAVTDMRWMFNHCSSLTSLDLSPFNTSAVTGMYSMFSYCSSLTNLDVSSFDTKSVTNMSYMFKQCTALDTLTLSTKFAFKEDTDLVDATWHGINTDKKYTTSVLTSTYNGATMADTYAKYIDIKFDALDGKSSESTKSGYIGMTFDSLPTAEKEGYDFVGWFTEKQGGTQLLVNQPITQSTYYAHYSQNAYAILYESGEFVFQRGNTPDAGKGNVLKTYTGFETARYGSPNYVPWHENSESIKAVSFKAAVKPVSTAYWFYKCKNLTSVDFTNLDTSAVTSMNGMFSSCSSLKSLDVSSFNTKTVTSMSYMFNGCRSLTSLDLSSFDTSAVTSMGYMFKDCSSLTSLDLSSFNTSVVTDMSSMFSSCSSLKSLDVSSFNTKTVTSMYSMFYDCRSLTSLDLSSFDTKAVTSMYSMFNNCSALTSLDLSSFDTKAVTSMKYMFKQCIALGTLTLGTKFAFKGDTKLVDATWHGFNTGKEYTTSVLTSTYDGPTMADTYAKYIDIKFDALDGKSSESTKSGYIGMAFDSLPTAEKEGYDFVGWFTEKQGGTQLLVNQPITQSTYYAQYTEHKYTITVTNDVAGTMGDKTKDFTFQLKMTGNTPAELPYTKGTETGKLKVTDGVVEFTLSDGESITLGNILIDTTYEITEVDGASNGYAVESTNSSGTLTEDTNVSFTNTRNGTVPTSAHTNILISIGVFAIALAGLFWHLRKRKQ